MNTDYLYYFKTLAEIRHYTKAAEKLNISQLSLSYAISSMERELGVPLFEKEGRTIRLNQYGELYYKAAVSSWDILETVKIQLQNRQRHTLHALNMGVTRSMVSSSFPPCSITTRPPLSPIFSPANWIWASVCPCRLIRESDSSASIPGMCAQ